MQPVEFTDYFSRKCALARFGDRKMNKTVKSLKRVGTDTADAFFIRSATRAEKLDRGEILLKEMRLTFEDPSDLLRVLTEQRSDSDDVRTGENP
jgi:hypothetical protein